MAEMIPDTISGEESATPGEKRTFRVLRDILQPDEDYLIWYEPRIIRRYPDFIIWSQDLGVLVLEVKDWGISQIESMGPKTFQLRIGDKIEECRNPLAQVRDAANQLMTSLKSTGSFLQTEGEYKGGLRFPIGYGVVWSNISRNQARQSKIVDVIEERICIFQDDLQADIQDREAQRIFVAKLKQIFTVWFDFTPLTYDELKTLRYIIFPEVRINNIRKLRTDGDEDTIRALDLEQERTAKSIGKGHRILKGVAGSGKTLVLACRAKYIKAINPKWRILVVCYNISLAHYLRKLIKISGHHSDAGNIEVYYFHELVRMLTKANLSKKKDESNDEWDTRIAAILEGRIAEGLVKRGTYDAILVDEGQDFTTDWMKALVKLLNEDTDSLLFCYDPAQNVFGRKRITWKNAGLKVQGKRPIELKTSYRNTIEILQIATKFSQINPLLPLIDDDEENLDATLFPISTDRHGLYPVLSQWLSIQDQIKYILDQIAYHIDNNECVWSDIGVLYTSARYGNFPCLFEEAFIKRFGVEKFYWVTRDRHSKMNLDVTSSTVKLITIESCKGLEFRVVFLIGLEELPRLNRDNEQERKLIYVGITRVQDILYIPYKESKGFVAEIIGIVQELTD